MRVLAAIPTRNRNCTKTVEQLWDGGFREIHVFSNGSQYHGRHAVRWHKAEMRLGEKRQFILDVAKEKDMDAVLMADDDLLFSPATLNALVETATNYPTLGAVSSEAKILYHWSKGLEPTLPFKIAPFPAQLFLMRLDAVYEAEDLVGLPLFTLNCLEDLAAGLRLWDAGWATAKLYDESLCHTPFIPRHGKGEGGGGQPTDERDSWMPNAVLQINASLVGPDEPLKSLTLSEKRTKHGTLRFNVRYNYEVMCERALDRFGAIGYEDSKGRKF